MRLIDADALLEQTQFRLPLNNYIAEIYDECVKIHRENIEQAPTIDAVPVVRCRDCKYAHMTLDGLCKYCDVIAAEGLDDAVYFEGDHYCSDGERKDGDE